MRLPRKLPARRLRPADLPASCGAASLLAQQYLRPISQGVKILSAPPADPPSFSRCPCDNQIRRRRGSRRTAGRSEEHTSELQSLMRLSYAVFCFNKKKTP